MVSRRQLFDGTTGFRSRPNVGYVIRAPLDSTCIMYTGGNHIAPQTPPHCGPPNVKSVPPRLLLAISVHEQLM